MRILGIDTSSLTASVAIMEDEVIKGEISFTSKLTHSQTIMPMIDEVLRGASLTPKDIDIFACANGPGSFTGLRIGIGTAKGLSFGTDKKAVGVCTLEALAHNITFFDGYICPIMDARRNSVYSAVYKSDGKGIALVREPQLIEVSKLCASLNDKCIFVGDGVHIYKEEIFKALGENSYFAPPQNCLPRASSVCRAALFKEAVSPEALDVLYLNKPQAERELEEKLNLNKEVK